jgi:hypothetical protein
VSISCVEHLCQCANLGGKSAILFFFVSIVSKWPSSGAISKLDKIRKSFLLNSLIAYVHLNFL